MKGGQMNFEQRVLDIHEKGPGKIEIKSKFAVKTREDLSILYTPGVAEPCKKIAENKEDVYKYTAKKNTVAVVTDGTAVLGLGDIGPEAALPVMEGKSILFKEFGNVDAIPICLDTKDTEEIIKTIKLISPSLGGINLEDIAAPRCFEIEKRLIEELDIPVFHDDQHGTAIVVLAGLINALKLVGKSLDSIKVVINGAGAAGTSIANHLMNAGVKDVLMCDINGILCKKDSGCYSEHMQKLAEVTNCKDITGKLSDAFEDADVFIGVSRGGLVTEEMIQKMNKDAIVFAMANPIPEIMPELARKAGARVVGSGRSDFPNQVNNLLAFPGIFKGALEARASKITEKMKIAASYAIASMISEEELSEEYVIPSALNKEVAIKVAKAVIDSVE